MERKITEEQKEWPGIIEVLLFLLEEEEAIFSLQWPSSGACANLGGNTEHVGDSQENGNPANAYIPRLHWFILYDGLLNGVPFCQNISDQKIAIKIQPLE